MPTPFASFPFPVSGLLFFVSSLLRACGWFTPPRMPRTQPNAADRVLRARLKEPLRFPDLTERQALKLAAVPHYTSRAHFGVWHRRIGGPDFNARTGIFTPLFFVEIEVADVRLTPLAALQVRGETYLAKTLEPSGAVDHILREGRHTLLADHDAAVVGRAHLINVFTRYDADPARRRVTALPAEMGLGPVPSRIATLPSIGDLIPSARRPDFAEHETHVWHYGQTDPNRHVSGMEYVRVMECYVSDVLRAAGHDLRRLYYARARILYRKPCFRGEGYRRVAWFCGEAPLVIAGAFYKDGDPPDARPAVAVELTLSQHDEQGSP